MKQTPELLVWLGAAMWETDPVFGSALAETEILSS
jgi:hypothetical protein